MRRSTASGRRKKSSGSRAQSWVLVLSIVSLVITVALWGTGEFIAERTWVTLLIAYAPPLLLAIPTVLVLLLSLLCRAKSAIILNSIVAVAGLFLCLGLALPIRHAVPQGIPLRVMTYNIEGGREGTEKIAQVIRQENPDVVCLQETRGDAQHSDPVPALEALLPGYRFTRAAEVAIASRIPTGNTKTISVVEGDRRVALATEVITGNGTVTVISAHLVTAAHPESLSSHGDSLPAYLHRTADIRERQIDKLLRAVRATTTPVLLCGDFNTPPRGIFYHRLADTFTDAFVTSGIGFGWTYPARYPCLRIDYIFLRGIGTTTTYVPVTHASDHRPVIADLIIPNAQSMP